MVRWTFDPLRHTNAHLNIGRLGAIVSTYCADYYGVMKGINAGLPSDRLLAEWHLDAPHVAALAADQSAAPPQPAPASVSIPESYEALLAGSPVTALAERLRVRRELQALMADGYVIRGYDRAGHRYLLYRG
jgi:predicted GNAT superfamily acetyltransferase